MPLTTRRYYTNTAVQQSLSVAVNSTDVTFVVPTGGYGTWPNTFPFYAAIDYGQPTLEIVKVTAISGTNATVTRAQNGTSAVSHPAGATFEPVVIAQDFDEANAHTSSGTGVHGISGQVVGATDTQTLSNKTIDASCTIQTPTITGTATLAGGHVTGNCQVDGTNTVATQHTTGNDTVDGTLAVAGTTTVSSLTASGEITDKHALKVNGESCLIYNNGPFTTSSIPGDGSWKVINNTNGVLFDSVFFSKGDLVNNRTGDASIQVTTPGLYEFYAVVDEATGGANVVGGVAPYVTPSGGSGSVQIDRTSFFGPTSRHVALARIVLGAGDKVQCALYQTTGSSQNLVLSHFGLTLLVAS